MQLPLLLHDLDAERRLLEGEEAIKMSLALASQEGLFTGISGGATSALPLPPPARRPPLSSCGGCV